MFHISYLVYRKYINQYNLVCANCRAFQFWFYTHKQHEIWFLRSSAACQLPENLSSLMLAILDGSLVARPLFFKSDIEMNFRHKQVAPSGGEILNHPLQQTWDQYINVAESTKLKKPSVVHLVYPWTSRQIRKIVKKQPHHPTQTFVWVNLLPEVFAEL